MTDVIINGGTRIQWDLVDGFNDPTPFVFQLQIGTTGDPLADDWTNLGTPITDHFFATDTTKRLYNKTLDTFYRVVLTTAVDTYISNPTNIGQWLNHYQWRMANDIVRKEELRQRMFAGQEGFLLCRRRYGAVCTECTDPVTKEILVPDCPTCFGTGIEGGYFTPIPAQYADLTLENSRESINMDGVGMSKPVSQKARFLGYPKLRSYDVWVNRRSDERYHLHTIEMAARIGGMHIVQMAELRLAPFTDVVYTFPINKILGV